MALILENKELETGIILENSYIRVTEVHCDKDNLNFIVGIYKDKDARQEGKRVILTKSYSCKHYVDSESYNSIKQAYEYLKTLEEFKDSIDDLEY